MFPFHGNAFFCFARSLQMCLHAAVIDPVPDIDFLESLTLKPFGNLAVQTPHGLLYYPGGIGDPDQGLTAAIQFLGWTSEEVCGGTADEALSRLKEAVKTGPVLIGPLDMGFLMYNAEHQYLGGADHFVAALDVTSDGVLLHDPSGYPFITLALKHFMQSWLGEQLHYGRHTFMMRSAFRQVEKVSRAEVIQRALPAIRENLHAVLNGPDIYTGPHAIDQLIASLQVGKINGMLKVFSFPLGAQCSFSGADFLRQAGLAEAGDLMERKSRLYSQALAYAADDSRSKLIDALEQMKATDEALIAAM